jgi:hypothetical protein
MGHPHPRPPGRPLLRPFRRRRGLPHPRLENRGHLHLSRLLHPPLNRGPVFTITLRHRLKSTLLCSALCAAALSARAAPRPNIVFTSDNGGVAVKSGKQQEDPITSNLPLSGGKGSLLEGGVRVPLIVAYPPLVKPGSATDAPVQSIDFYPTFLDLVGALSGKLERFLIETDAVIPPVNPDAADRPKN